MTLDDEDQTQDGKAAAGEETPFVVDAGAISDQTDPDVGDVEFDSMEADFEAALDIGTWTSGEQIHTLTARLERDFEQAARHEEGMAPRILRALEDGLPNAADASKENGLYTLRPDEITGALKSVLFNGLVEGCDGTRVIVPTLPMTVVQIGVCLTSYQGSGDGGSIGHRLYRHDIIRRNANAENAVYDFLARRARRRVRRGVEFGDDGQETSLSDMMCRALMTYGERAMLADRSQRQWRIGHGGPMPHELIVGSGRKELAFASLKMLRRLLLEHKKFIFVPSEIGDEAVVTIANALLPLQYAVLRNTKDIIQGYIEGSSYERPHYERSGLIQEVRAFQEDAGSKTVLCVYRSSSLAPGRIFYAHEDHVHEAAQIVMADSTLQETRGFPNLIDIADRMCRGMFEPGGLTAQVHAALARTGSPFRFLNERETRA